MYDDISEAKNKTTFPISSGTPILPIGKSNFVGSGFRSVRVSFPCDRRRAVPGVRISPGATALIQILSLASSSATFLVNPQTPCFEAS